MIFFPLKIDVDYYKAEKVLFFCEKIVEKII